METITVAMVANADYGDPLLVAVGTLVRHASVSVRFEILDGGLSAVQKALLSDTVAAVTAPRHEIHFVPIDDSRFRRYRLMNGNAMAYVRLLMPDLLDVDWVLYCDADVLWHADVAKLWRQRDDSVWAIATPDCKVSALKDNGVPGVYFCSGIMIANLSVWRRERLGQRCVDWLESNPSPCFWDQSALNRVLEGRVKLVDKSWNRYVDEDGACNVLHYAGANPWRFGFRANRLDSYKRRWFRELAKLKGTWWVMEAIRKKLGGGR